MMMTLSAATGVSALLLVATLTSTASGAFSTTITPSTSITLTTATGLPTTTTLFFGTAVKTRTEAEDECNKKGGHLFDPRSEEELQNWKGSGQYWTGIKSKDSGETWAYSDGSQLSDWALNIVRNALDYSGDKQTRCVAFLLDNSGFISWDQVTCDNELKYACDLTKAPAGSCPCGDVVQQLQEAITLIAGLKTEMKELEMELKHVETGLILCGIDTTWKGHDGIPNNHGLPDLKRPDVWTKDVRVVFKKPYKTKPVVSFGLMQLDNNGRAANNRISNKIVRVDTHGFTFRCGIWSDSKGKMYRLGFNWKSDPQ